MAATDQRTSKHLGKTPILPQVLKRFPQVLKRERPKRGDTIQVHFRSVDGKKSWPKVVRGVVVALAGIPGREKITIRREVAGEAARGHAAPRPAAPPAYALRSPPAAAIHFFNVGDHARIRAFLSAVRARLRLQQIVGRQPGEDVGAVEAQADEGQILVAHAARDGTPGGGGRLRGRRDSSRAVIRVRACA